MKVCIVGAGVVGSYLARRLSRENHEVAVIDFDPSKLEQITYSYDVLTINCDALQVNCLKNVEEFDLFVVVTESDEKNLAIALLLKSLFRKERVVVRVSNKGFSSPPVKEFLKSEIVNILSETVQTILFQIKYPFSVSTLRLEGEGLIIFKYPLEVEDLLAGKQIKELKELRYVVGFTILAIERGNEVIIPSGEDFFYPGDRIYIVTKEQDAFRVAEALRLRIEPVNYVFVLGNSRFTEELIAKLSDFKNLKVKFFSPDIEACEAISGKYPNVYTFHGDLTDVELLKQEGIGDSDLTIAVSDDEETNILSGVLAKRLGSRKVCSLITHPEYETIVESIGIDVPLVPRKLLASKVYCQISSKGFLEMLELSERLEIVEMKTPKELSGKAVAEVGKKLGSLIFALRRNGETQLVRGDTVLQEGDVIISLEKRQ